MVNVLTKRVKFATSILPSLCIGAQRHKSAARKKNEQEKEEEESAMGDLLSWLFSFFLLVAVLVTILYQLMCLADLEYDYVNPYDSASRINRVVVPEFALQGALCFLHLVTGHWLMFLICLPYLYYNIKVNLVGSESSFGSDLIWTIIRYTKLFYTDRCHLVDVTEIFNQLPWDKKVRLYKLGYLVILLAFSIFWMVWSIVDE